MNKQEMLEYSNKARNAADTLDHYVDSTTYMIFDQDEIIERLTAERDEAVEALETCYGLSLTMSGNLDAAIQSVCKEALAARQSSEEGGG